MTLEGPEGSGKSSQARCLVQALRRRGYSVVFIQDPGSTLLGQRLRAVLLHARFQRLSPLAEAFLFIAGRLQLLEEQIRPALRRGRIVVCDRFHDAMIAYQGYGGRLPIGWLDRLGRGAIGGLMPDLMILLDVPTAVGFGRLTGIKDRMERKGLAFHRRVRNGYRQMAQRHPRRFRLINATQSKAQIDRQVVDTVMRHLARSRS